jgi:hypothetical protein
LSKEEFNIARSRVEHMRPTASDRKYNENFEEDDADIPEEVLKEAMAKKMERIL